MSQKNPLHIPSPFRVEAIDMTPEQKEQEYVHNVYQPWPVVEEFLKTMPPGFVGADVGCGNGKYIGVNPKLFMVGSDSICGERGHEAMVCDGLALPYRPEFFDFAISIAVIHHFISPERRIAAIEEILRVVRVGGRVLIFVWALEQTGKRDFDKNVQDVFVPWAMPKKAEPKKDKTKSRPQGVKRKDKKKDLPSLEGDNVTEPTNRLVTNDNAGQQHSMTEGITSAASTPSTTTSTQTPGVEEQIPEQKELAAPVYNRYYHLFQKGELEDLVLKTNKASILQQGYDRDNWWCILEKISNA
ncbi:tRNA methyltransferase, has a role in tRNA modification [Mortierella polycephala]|uniref:tRNA methyltransferase, has a role in tRNA modification n=1 Tax=Mortierella polycephala TaxID=41804 RepID=A0A9P6Q0E5_9FUNG|nr:tRNA methyltransferase, has a role in tRNA modification [Mortierella polycephala]